MPVVVQTPLPLVVTIPHANGPKPTKMLESTGSKLALASEGLTVIRLAGKLVHVPVQLTVEPVRVYWASWQVLLPQTLTALSHAERPELDQ